MHLKQLQVKLKPEKNSGLNGIQTHCLCDTSAVLSYMYQAIWESWLLFFSGLNFATASVVCIAVNVSHVFTRFSTVQINELSYILIFA